MAHSTANRHSVAPWLNWIEQPPPKGQVIGSNPIGVAILHISLN
jgi:hypothetical protein